MLAGCEYKFVAALFTDECFVFVHSVLPRLEIMILCPPADLHRPLSDVMFEFDNALTEDGTY